ncbi:conserved hypothetical protein [Neospora caninum Liverpool]|uniref:Uncharacterized protein n=1 Tax=Neospora caninum (strain Liverpool) TaxID=572307 RepID=F0VDE0_NEOCL|nr:conserved hypothetical protein [Neospora caninum Liverpool]CBZ51655.1 conserved hypothetical protein [Neospora caninum Liverpool]CEL65609.1 TPA: hypothetical protein BN1204_014490 [Neospora caninum Liverpool]|eukprot:XP_003881688.1 conserved hypothetical protein [Neospora caninum Liverpool]
MRIHNQSPPLTYESGPLAWWQWPLGLLDTVLSGSESPSGIMSRKGSSFIEQLLATTLCAALLFLLLRKLLIDYKVELMWQRFVEDLTDALSADELEISNIQHLIRSELSSPELSGRLRSRHGCELFRTLRLRQDKILTQDFNAVASEVAALGVPVDLAVLGAETKRPRTRRPDIARGSSNICGWARMGTVARTLLLHVTSVCRLFMYTVQEASDMIFNDPASSLVVLCI